MLILSSPLLWAVIQVLICVSQTKPQEVNQEEDAPFCQHIAPDKCKEAGVMALCPVLCPSPAIDEPIDPPSWILIDLQIFFVTNSSHELTWKGARNYCVNLGLGADLAQPKDLFTLDGLATYIDDDPFHDNDWYWMGGSNQNTEEEWTWLNGSAITLGLAGGWDPDKPGVGAGECLTILPWHDNMARTLAAKPCNQYRPFICQIHGR